METQAPYLTAPPPLDAAEADAFGPPPGEDARQAWNIQSDAQADWAMAHLADLQADLAHAQRTAQERMEKILAWLDGEKAKHAREAAWFEGHLEFYLRKLNEADPKKKTLNLPNGKRQLRKAPPTWLWPEGDEARALEAYAALAGLVRTRIEVDRAALKARCVVRDGHAVDPETGEVLPVLVETPEALSYTGGAK